MLGLPLTTVCRVWPCVHTRMRAQANTAQLARLVHAGLGAAAVPGSAGDGKGLGETELSQACTEYHDTHGHPPPRPAAGGGAGETGDREGTREHAW